MSKRTAAPVVAISELAGSIPIGEIKPAPYNPRVDLQPADAEYQAIKASLDEFGLVQPLVWNRRSGHLVGGHQRFKVLVELGRKAFEVGRELVVVDLDERDERRLNLALNRVEGSWDEDKLATVLADLWTSADDTSGLLATGFSEDELSDALKLLKQAQTNEPEQPQTGASSIVTPSSFPAVNPEAIQGEVTHECPRCKFRF